MKNKTIDKLPIEDKLVLIYLDNLEDEPTVGKYNDGGSWTVLHEINNEQPISFGECIPVAWAYIQN